MILQALVEYYQRLITEGNTEIAQQGFQTKRIPFLLSIDDDGKLLSIVDTRLEGGNKKQARSFQVPKIFEGSRTVNIKANLLWDKASYIFGISPNSNLERLMKQRQAFYETLLEYFPYTDKAKSIQAVINFLDYHVDDIKLYKEWEEISTKDPNIAFKMNTEEGLICNSYAVLEMLANRTSETWGNGTSLISGKYEQLARLENPIKGLRGAGVAESHWVAFNKDAYWSYGKNDKKAGLNAPIGKSSSADYVLAFNYLQRIGSTQKFQIGDTTTVFWAEKKNKMENVFQELFGYQPANQENEQDYRQLLALFRSSETGVEQANLDPSTKFYVLGLAPNAARIAVRFWYAGTVGTVANNIYQHFEDLNMVKSKNEWRRIDLRSLLRSTALREKDENVIPNLAGTVMESILTGTPYPQTLLSAVLTRIKSEQSAKGPNGKSKPNATYSRIALVKAILVRDTRYHNKNTQEVNMSLDITNTNPGYLLGRLFAVLERTQERANPGLNATIRDRFYGAASSTPITAFPYLMKLKNFHIAKLDNKGEVVNTEKQIGEILSKLEAASGFPTHLSLQDQGRFAVGYYHQRQEFFTKKEN
jgi:CRISPR-associated protein Csd1